MRLVSPSASPGATRTRREVSPENGCGLMAQTLRRLRLPVAVHAAPSDSLPVGSRPAAKALDPLLFPVGSIIAPCGLVPFFRRRPRLIAPLLVPVVLQYILISSWWAYSFGSSVGHRGFFTILPILLLGLASLFDAMATRGRATLMTAALFILTCLNLLLLLLISAQIVPV